MRLRIYVPLLLWAALSPVHLAAQVGSTTDILTGHVLNADKQPLAGAKIVATSVETGISRSTLTDAKGKYTIIFPDGGGRYRLRTSYIGTADQLTNVVREADEDVLVANVTMSINPIAIQGIEVRAQRPPPGRGDAGSQERALPSDLVQRLPVPDYDPATLAQLTPGVVAATNGDSADLRNAFSVGGQRTTQNSTTLDGQSFGSALTGGAGGSPVGVPQEGLRSTNVITSSFDVARGQFSGGQVAMTTRGGTNLVQSSFNYQFQNPALQGGSNNSIFGNGFTQQRLSGGIGGPVKKDKVLYYVSFSTQRRTDNLYSLTPSDPLIFPRLGTSPDSVTRFLGLLTSVYGINTAGQTGAYDRTGNALSLLTRLDFHLGDKHSLMVRANGTLYGQDSTRIGILELRQDGGENTVSGGGGMMSLTSRLGGSWINEAKVSYNDEHRNLRTYAPVPEGRVRVESTLPDGTKGITSFGFGGDRALPTTTQERALEVTNELSFLLGDKHRLKLGALLNNTAFTQQQATNRYGTFTFNSLADFEARRAASFTRSLSPRESAGGGINSALYLGDSWRPKTGLQLTYGARLEASRFNDKPDYNPVVFQAFALHTDFVPTELHASPRIGFTWRLDQPQATAAARVAEREQQQRARRATGAPGDSARTGGASASAGARTGGAATSDANSASSAGERGGRGGAGGGGGRGGAGAFGGGGFAGGGAAAGRGQVRAPRPARLLRGGVGEFRGRAPFSLFASAIDQTGLSNAESTLTCIGASVPTPDWNLYALDPAAIPSACLPGPIVQLEGGRLPNVTLFDKDFGAPRSWRATLGLQTPLVGLLQGSFDFSYTRGMALYGVEDLNLNTTNGFTIPNEANRPVFASANAIVPTTGEVAPFSSRLHPELGSVFALTSNLQSQSVQFTSSISGVIPPRMFMQVSYTVMRSTDQSSFSCCSAQQGFSSPTTAGNPNIHTWGTSDLDRRHMFTALAGMPIGQTFEFTLVGRLVSGSPFTPIVGSDINGDGARDDRAFLFNPATTPDTAVANGISRLLAIVPGRVRSCMEKQIGALAARNSCRSGWSENVSLRTTIKPNLGARLGRRLNIGVDVMNVTGGLDKLLHGSSVRGWGQPDIADPTLLYPRGFDPATRTFKYQVNELFGQNRTQRFGSGSPFQIQVSARLALGAQNSTLGLGAIAFGGGGGGERGGPGGPRIVGPGGAGAPGGLGGFDISTIAPRMLPNPVLRILEMKDSLHLSADQVARLEVVSDSLKAHNEPLLAQLQEKVKAAGNTTDFGQLFGVVGPIIQKGRQHINDALAEAQKILTPEQWTKVPGNVRNPGGGIRMR